MWVHVGIHTRNLQGFLILFVCWKIILDLGALTMARKSESIHWSFWTAKPRGLFVGPNVTCSVQPQLEEDLESVVPGALEEVGCINKDWPLDQVIQLIGDQKIPTRVINPPVVWFMDVYSTIEYYRCLYYAPLVLLYQSPEVHSAWSRRDFETPTIHGPASTWTFPALRIGSCTKTSNARWSSSSRNSRFDTYFFEHRDCPILVGKYPCSRW